MYFRILTYTAIYVNIAIENLYESGVICMADYIKALRELQLSYIFNANMASVDLSEEDGYSVFKMDNTSFSFQFADD